MKFVHVVAVKSEKFQYKCGLPCTYMAYSHIPVVSCSCSLMITYVDERIRTVLGFTHGFAKFNSIPWTHLKVRYFCVKRQKCAKSSRSVQNEVICGLQWDIWNTSAPGPARPGPGLDNTTAPESLSFPANRWLEFVLKKRRISAYYGGSLK